MRQNDNAIPIVGKPVRPNRNPTPEPQPRRAEVATFVWWLEPARLMLSKSIFVANPVASTGFDGVVDQSATTVNSRIKRRRPSSARR